MATCHFFYGVLSFFYLCLFVFSFLFSLFTYLQLLLSAITMKYFCTKINNENIQQKILRLIGHVQKTFFDAIVDIGIWCYIFIHNNLSKSSNS